MAYREPHDPPLRAWALTSAGRWRFVGAVAIALIFTGPVCLFAATSHLHVADAWLGYVVATLPGAALVAIAALGGDGYRVHGGRGEMRLFRDRLEIPRARRAGVDVLALGAIETSITTIRSRLNGVEVNQTLLLEIRSGVEHRTLAHPLLGGQDVLRRLADDLDRARRGEPLTRDPDPDPEPAQRDALDHRIDEELRKM